jgi:hypothetical protein
MDFNRDAEVYSADRKHRLVVLGRPDGYFQISQERVLSYESGDEYNPTIESFPEDGLLPEWSLIDEHIMDGLFGSAADAEAEARRLLSVG